MKERFHVLNNPCFDVDQNVIEIVERKGKGHPDSLTDGLGVVMSARYSRYTLEHFGGVAHHNIDKIVTSGGAAEVHFGGGKQTEPVSVNFVGRAFREYVHKDSGKLTEIPLYFLAKESAKEVFNRIVPNLTYKLDVNEIKRGSDDLITNFQENNGIPLANDTSFATSWAPLSRVEKLVTSLENYLNSNYRGSHQWLGPDIKVMARRIDDDIILNIASAFISKEISAASDYIDKRAELKEEICQFTKLPVENIFLNTADNDEKGSFYITVTGTSLEQGDDGAIGRGNRVTGVIAPYRPQTLEAMAGKNPNKHVGNFYNVWATLIARKIHRELGAKNTVTLVSTIGKPITECDIFVTTAEEVTKTDMEPIAMEIIQDYQEITRKIIKLDLEMYPFDFVK